MWAPSRVKLHQEKCHHPELQEEKAAQVSREAKGLQRGADLDICCLETIIETAGRRIFAGLSL